MDSRLLISDDVVADSVIAGTHEDEFDHTAIASRVGELISVVEPPLNIALFGPWGSGKSSFFGLLKQTVEARDKSAQVVRYDAWKFGGDALKRNFITALAKELRLDGEKYSRKLYETTKTVRLDLKAFLGNWKQLLLLIAAALAVSVTWALIAAVPSLVALAVNGAQPDAYWAAFGRVLATSISTVGLVFAAVFVGIKAFESANVSVESAAANSDEQFVEAFRELIKDALKRKPSRKNRPKRLVIYIDELDRCSPRDVVSTLVSLKTFLDEHGCIFVVAADREVLEAALDDELEHKVPFRADEPYYSTAGAFLDKIFQHQIALPPLRQRALTKFARALVIDAGGIWEELRDRPAAGNDFESVVYTLIPAHVRSPRRVKVLLNNFALNARVVESRGLHWRERACQIAVLTVLQTEFPAVANAMVHEPRLLERIRTVRQQSDDPMEQTVQRLLVSKAPSEEAQKVGGSDGELDDSAAGRLLGGENVGASTDLVRVRARLTDQLNRYLRRISELGVPDPTPDLIFMQPLGQLETLENPDLGAVIDAAPDESPAATIISLDAQSVTDQQTALAVLAGESETTFGPSRANLVEVICSIAARMPSGALSAISGSVLPAVKAAVAEPGAPARWLPGAIALAASVDDDSAVRGWIVDLGDDPEDVLPLVDQLYRLRGQSQITALESVGRAGASSAGLFVYAFGMLDPPIAGRLLEHQSGSMQVFLSTLETTESYEELLDAVRDRPDLDPAILNGLIELGLSSDNEIARALAEEQAFNQVELDPAAPLAPSLALSVVGRARASDLVKWARMPGGESTAEAIDQAIVHIFDLLAEVSDADELTAAETILSRVAEIRAVGEVDAAMITKAAEACLEGRQWTAESANVGASLYVGVLAVAPLIGRDRAIELLASDFVSEAASLTTQDAVDAALTVAQKMPADVASAISRRIDETDLSAVESSIVVRIHLKLVTAAKVRTSVKFDAIESLVPTPTGKVIYQDWVACGASLNEVLRAMPIAGIPTTKSMSELTKWLTDEERGRLWIRLRRTAGHTFQHLRTAAARGASVDAVKFNEPALGAARASQRADAVRILLTLPLDRPSDVQRSASGIVLRFLSKNQKADTELAIKILIHARGAGYRYKTQLRAALEIAERSHPRAFRDSDRKKLSEFGLL